MKKLFILLLAIFFSVTGCSTKTGKTEKIFDDIEARQPWIIAGSSTLVSYRYGVENLSETHALLAIGKQAAEIAKKRIQQSGPDDADGTMAIAAYVIEKNKLTAAVPVLENFILSNPGDRGYVWSPYFVVRALLVLKGLPDTTDGYKEYTEQDFVRALQK